MDFGYLEGRKFCVVFVKVLSEAGIEKKVQMRCLRGRASIERGRVSVVTPEGAGFAVPGSALHRILPNDGTAMLKDAEYYVIVRVDPQVDLGPFDPDAMVEDDAGGDGGHVHGPGCGCGG